MKVEAEISDSTHLVLRQPLAIPAGRRVLVEIIEDDSDLDRGEYLSASAALLERAFGPDEPDYSEAGEAL
ncbi:MAG: hypothetical protein KDM91_18850 [Verrucomicrobiae bacterium]|nr:hypothetical protein [Verrucomicrobiae bacterium]MCP5539678.1 hypothetical protein [Akkermansiaceae bacterium]MCP5549417.1 hypothetical protein [Akkermansiaceae bacterium]